MDRVQRRLTYGLLSQTKKEEKMASVGVYISYGLYGCGALSALGICSCNKNDTFLLAAVNA